MATGSTAAPAPPAFGFALLSREANALNFSITNIDASVRQMRILAVDNTSPSGEMIREVVPMPAVGSDLSYRLGGLTLGHKYDVRLSLYDNVFGPVDEEELLDLVPASAPPKPVLNGLVNRDEGLFQMEVNVGSSVGDEITRIVSNIYDKINDVLTSQVHGIAGAIPSDRKVVIPLNLTKGGEYKITVSSMNRIGDSPLSDNMPLTASDLPNNPSAVSFGLINNELKATWTKPADAETFANLKFDVKFILKWGAGTTAGEAVFAQSAVNAVAGSGASRYSSVANVNQFTAGFSQAEIDAFLATQPLAARDSRLLSVVCRISSKAGAFVRDPRDYLEAANTVSFLNVPQSVADNISSKISVVASLSTRASASAVPSLSLAASKTAADRTSISNMTWFNKVIFNAKYTQSDADADGDDEETDLSLTLLNSQSSNSNSAALVGSVYAPSDSASIAFYFEDGNGVKSPVFALPAQHPQNPSVLGAAGMDSPKCQQGMLKTVVSVSQGNSQSMDAEATLKITSQAPATAQTTSPVSLVADPDNAGFYKLSFPFTALTNLQQGDSVDVVIKLYERFGNASSSRVVFHVSSLNTVTYRNENFSSLIVQGPTALEMFVCDLQANPQSTSDYAAFIGFNKAAYAGAQGSNRDRSGAADGSEVDYALETTGASPKYVEFSLKASSATYMRHVNNAQEALLPVDLRVAIDCDRLEVPSAADLDAAKARSGFTGVLANFIWFKCVRSSLAPGLVEFAVVASRVINGVRYNSSNEVSATITDPAFIQTIGKSLQATADGVAIPISFNGNSSVSMKIVRVPVIGDGEQASTVSEYTGTVVPADLVGGYRKVYFSTPSSAYIVAMSTTGSANSLIVKLIQSSGAAPTAVLPAPVTTGLMANQTVLY